MNLLVSNPIGRNRLCSLVTAALLFKQDGREVVRLLSRLEIGFGRAE